MEIVLDNGKTVREVVVEAPEGLSVDDMLIAAGWQGPAFLGGVALDRGEPLGRSVPTGSVVSATSRIEPPLPGAEVAVLTGPDSGATRDLEGANTAGPPTEVVVGRGTDADLKVDDPTMSRRHFAVRVTDDQFTLRDMGSSGGTWVDGLASSGETPVASGMLVEAGSTVLATRRLTPEPHLPHTRSRPGGTAALNRPPRAAPELAPVPLAVPGDAKAPAKAAFTIVSLVGPLLVAGVMVVIQGNPAYALLAIAGPATMIGGTIAQRRRAARTGRRVQLDRGEQLNRFRAGVVAARHDASRRARDLTPDAAVVVRRAEHAGARLWERRPRSPDYLMLALGYGDEPWSPPLAGTPRPDDDDVREIIEAAGNLANVPVVVDFGETPICGIAGPRADGAAIARSLLLQLAVHHGPADISVAVVTDQQGAPEWEWAKWLPHTAGEEVRQVAAGPDTAALLKALLDAEPRGDRRLFVVIDSPGATEGTEAPARTLIERDNVTGVVLADSTVGLPAACGAVVTLDGREARLDGRTGNWLWSGISRARAQRAARQLARFEDPATRAAERRAPDVVGLLDLLGLNPPKPQLIADRWAAAAGRDALATPVGAGSNGPVVVDLVHDGPHTILGGTTGSGKSETLRSLIAGLAANCSPAELNLVLVDFKGNSTFAELAHLPHTVGVASNLDAQLASRALRCLQAELAYRQRLFDACGGVKDLPTYRAMRNRAATALEPLPRLVVVIDEFAQMAEALPDFLNTLVNVAQVGRSLGVHLVLATQDPGKAITPDIDKNVDLRIALRLKNGADSAGVIGSTIAATIRKSPAGGAYVKHNEELTFVQTAFSSAATHDGGGVRSINLRPFTFAPAEPISAAAPGEEGATELDVLIEAIIEATQLAPAPAPRRPWTDPLPSEVDLTAVIAAWEGDGVVPMMMVDDPDHQEQYPSGWNLASGNLLMFGVAGSGTTTALCSLGLSAASRFQPDQLHIYAIDYGGGGLAPLAALPHTGAVIAGRDRERQIRLIRFLRGQLERRRNGERREPRMMLLIDNFAAFNADLDDAIGMELLANLERVYADGPALGIWTAYTADRPGAVPNSTLSVTPQRLIFKLADVFDYGIFGIAVGDVPSGGAGRAVSAATHQVCQVARATAPDVFAAALAARSRAPASRPEPIGVLPRLVPLAVVSGRAVVTAEPWTIPLGLGDDNLQPVGLRLYEAENALIAGPARSGKSTGLRCAAEALFGAPVTVSVIALRRSLLRDFATARGLSLATADDQMGGLVEKVGKGAGRQVLLVDDAEFVEDKDNWFGELLGLHRPDVHLIITGRPENLRGLYGHWTQLVRRSKVGLLLRPNLDLDGDMFAASLPRRQWVPDAPGRGYLLADGQLELIQVATSVEAATETAAQKSGPERNQYVPTRSRHS